MPLSLILALIVLGAGALAIPFVPRHLRIPVGTGLVILIAGLLFSASATLVPTRTVAVEVSLGRPVGTLQNGFTMVAPWHKVEKFDASVQFLIKQGDGQCITVRLGNQTTACVDIIRSQWNIDPNGDIIELYRRYKQFDRIEHTVITGEATHALVDTFSTFDPLGGIATSGKVDTTTKPSIDQLATQARTQMQQSLGTGIKVDSLLLFVHYDTTTQNKLNNYAQALADTRIATQQTLTAEQVALANKALATQASVTNPGVQYQNCLSLVRDLATKDQLKDLPPTFNCGDPRTSIIVGGSNGR
jgi:hypothetical protein